MAKRKTFKRILLLILVAAVAVGAWLLPPALGVMSAYQAKTACSCVLVAGRPLEQVRQQELATLGMIVKAEVDHQRGLARASLLGLGLMERTAVRIPGLGCTLVPGNDPARLAARGAALGPRPDNPAQSEPWPLGNGRDPRPLPVGINAALLDKAVEKAFQQDEADRPVNTRAVLVVYQGRLVAERYAPGFGPRNLHTGWSMTKSVVSALVGVLVGQGRLDLYAPAPVPAWREPGDTRGSIRLVDLLQMQSGLQWSETYTSPFCDVLKLLFVAPSSAGYAASKPLAHTPGGTWYYSSGTTNIISGIIRRTLGDDKAYWSFPRTVLFDPLGMTSAVMETDAAGNFVGSSFMFATARDWARFGLLYLNDGVWRGRRILPPGWVSLTTRPASAAPQHKYGLQWWLNLGAPGDPSDRRFPTIPRDVYMAQGYKGQCVAVIPSRDAVVVRLGFTRQPRFDAGALVSDVLAALPKQQAAVASTRNR